MPEKISDSHRLTPTTYLKAHEIPTNAKKHFKYWQTRTRESGLTAFLIVEVLLIFVVLPLEANGQVTSAIAAVMIGLFVVTSFVVALQSVLAIAVLAASITVSQFIGLIYDTHSSTLTDWCDAAARHTAICAVSWVIARIVFNPGRISVYRVEAAVALYLNIGLFFFTTYRFVLSIIPGALSGLMVGSDPYRSGSELLYFSFASLVASGYRGIEPVGPLTHNLVMTESLIGLLYPVVILIWFVLLQIRQSDS